jgi:hypothetical protein
MNRTKAIAALAAVVLAAGCGSQDNAGNDGDGGPTLDPTSYTTPLTETTGPTTGATTGGSSGGRVIKIGGPNAENRNPRTPWPTIYADSTSYGCTERHNTGADIPVTVTDARIVGTLVHLVTNWGECEKQGYDDRPADHGCAGRTLQPDPDLAGRGCLLALRVDPIHAAEHRVVLRLSFRATCRSARERPCGSLTEFPASVQWTADETVTVRDRNFDEVTTSNPPESTSDTATTTTPTS